MSRKTNYARRGLVPTRDPDRPSHSSPRLSPRSSSPPPSSFTIGDDDDDDNASSDHRASSQSGRSNAERYRRQRRRQLHNTDTDDENDTYDNEALKESPRHGVSSPSANSHASSGNNGNVNRGSGLDTLRSAMGGFGGDENDVPEVEERRELSPRSKGGGIEFAAEGAEASLPHPEEVRSPSARSTGSSGGGQRNFALMAFLCPFLTLVDIARREGAAIFWRLLPSILVTKAFGLSLGTLFLCDLATIVAIVDEEKHLEYLDGGSANTTVPVKDDELDGERFLTEASKVGDEDGDGMVRLTFGLWSYSTKLEDHASTDDDVSFIVSEEERLTTCSYHMLDVEEGMIFWLDPMFNCARAFGIIAVVVGFVAVVMLWLGVIRVRVIESRDGSRRKFKGRGLKHTVTIALILCSAFEGLTLLIFQAGMCGNKRMEETYGQIYRDCEIAEGSSSPISAIVFWFLTGLAMLKLPNDEAEVSPSGSSSEFGADDGIAYGTGEDVENEDDDDSYDMEEEQLGPKPSWFKRMFGVKSTPLPQSDVQRVDGYTTELRFDDDYADDEWIDNKGGVGSPGIQMREIT